MTVVDHHVTPQGSGGVIVDAASAISDITHDDTLCPAESFDNVDDGAAVHEQPFWHLQSHPSSAILFNLSYSLGDFKVVIGW